jgi:hypothetical protein
MRVLLVFLLALNGLLCAQQSPAAQSRMEPGSIEKGTYRNTAFGFQYKVPYGWVDRTEQMRDPSADPGKSLLLLATFERPPEVNENSVNSAVVITAERASSYQRVKTAADYFSVVTEAATSKGFEAVNEPYYFQLSGKRLVRSDFTKKIGQVTMYQSSLATLERGYFVSFTFLGGTDAEADRLIENLIFDHAARKVDPGRK